ncbi:hypothetical protein IMG5_133660 [Ichthyophthirius multifiliis]|uniref:HIT domain-containing protein n=1 Tax=Ichthyophthirius multifiliis TaxID=5932 RepID=G0QWN6_ICHMU|nr:hypothetical protein IMG5_133660 [Ichthyophthirius multifiliis]EGR30371.1 hypothetical protein IMG5_133660 [Ichthyophthirius multifiliis]|eukprot:XP_004031958.1 hypothetical protein IMG5_133660 [Ichthyophthirius multifiliis]
MINTLKLGQYNIPQQFILWQKSYTCAIIPCVQLMPGHILLLPKRYVSNFCELEAGENHQPENPDSIDQIYVHIIPRRKGDYQKNDDIYFVLENYDKEFAKQYQNTISSTNSFSNAAIEIQGQETKKYKTFLDQFWQEEYNQQ